MDVEQGAPATGLRLFASTIDEPRGRRATDVLLLIGSTLGLLALGVASEPPPSFVVALRDFVASFPDLLEVIWLVLGELLWIAPLVLVLGVGFRRRWAVLRDLLIALALATVAWLVAARSSSDSWPNLWDAFRSAGPPPWYPSLRIAACGTVFVTAAPHLTTPVRRLARRLLVGGTIGLVVLEATTEMGALAGIFVAGFAASTVHLVFGSSGGRPSLEFVRASLAEFGVTVAALGAADRQQAGLFVVDATATDGSPLIVKVYGRDAYDSALVSTLWRKVWFREAGVPLRVGRLQQVEHEALVTLFVAQGGIPTDEVVAAGATLDDDALLVLRRSGRAPAEINGATDIDAFWAVVERLHRTGVAHGRIDVANVLEADGAERFGLVGFRGSTMGADDADRRSDEVQTFITTLLATDEEAAIAGAQRALGADGVERMLPFLQRSVLTSLQRQAFGDQDIDLDTIRANLAATVEREAPKLIQLRRFTIGSVLRIALPIIALFALFSGLAGLDIDEMREVLQEASWWIVAVGAVVAQLPRVTQAVSTLGASPVPLPLGPVYALQLAVSYINLAIPSSAARMAVNIRFFQRHGVPPGGALTAGAIDGFSGFIVQALLLGGLVLLTPTSLDLDLNRSSESGNGMLVLVVVFAAVAIGVFIAAGRLRRFVLKWARQMAAEARTAARGLRSPRRLALLFGGNLATELLFAITLGTFTRAVGYDVGLNELLVINMSVSLLSGLIPVPGGIGVTEGGLTLGLVRAGMPQEVAFTAVIMYRIATFYVPPVWGFFSFRWLERNGHI
jgi:uncharacterized membrane protein YbhN (UPF0104 family)